MWRTEGALGLAEIAVVPRTLRLNRWWRRRVIEGDAAGAVTTPTPHLSGDRSRRPVVCAAAPLPPSLPPPHPPSPPPHPVRALCSTAPLPRPGSSSPGLPRHRGRSDSPSPLSTVTIVSKSRRSGQSSAPAMAAAREGCACAPRRLTRVRSVADSTRASVGGPPPSRRHPPRRVYPAERTAVGDDELAGADRCGGGRVGAAVSGRPHPSLLPPAAARRRLRAPTQPPLLHVQGRRRRSPMIPDLQSRNRFPVDLSASFRSVPQRRFNEMEIVGEY